MASMAHFRKPIDPPPDDTIINVDDKNYYQILGVSSDAQLKPTITNALHALPENDDADIIKITLVRLRQLYDNGLKIGVPPQQLHYFFKEVIDRVEQQIKDNERTDYSHITTGMLLIYCVRHKIITNERDKLTDNVYNLTYYEILDIHPDATHEQITGAIQAAPELLKFYIREIQYILTNDANKQVYDYGLLHNVNPLKLHIYCKEGIRLQHSISIQSLRQYCIDNNIHIDSENSIPEPTPPIITKKPDLPLDIQTPPRQQAQRLNPIPPNSPPLDVTKVSPFPEIQTPPRPQAQRLNSHPMGQTLFSAPQPNPMVDSNPPMSGLLYQNHPNNNNNLRYQQPPTRGTILHNQVANINNIREATHPVALTNDEQMSAYGIAGAALAAAVIAVPVATMLLGGKKKKKKKSLKNNKHPHKKFKRTRKHKRRCHTCKKYKRS